MLKFQRPPSDIDIENLFKSIPTEYRRTNHELGVAREGDPTESYLCIEAFEWMMNNTSNREMRERIRALKQFLCEQEL